MLMLGMIFLAILFQPLLENLYATIMVKFCCCNRDRKLLSLLRKNMKSHKTRNMKTAMMFALCLAFLIFATTSFQLMGNMMIKEVETALAADLYASNFLGDTGTFLNEGNMTVFLED